MTTINFKSLAPATRKAVIDKIINVNGSRPTRMRGPYRNPINPEYPKALFYIVTQSLV